MFAADDDEDEQKVVKIDIPKYKILHTDIDPQYLEKIIEGKSKKVYFRLLFIYWRV